MLGFGQCCVVLKTETLWCYSPSFVAPLRHPYSLRIISFSSHRRASRLTSLFCVHPCVSLLARLSFLVRLCVPPFGCPWLRVALGCPSLPSSLLALLALCHSADSLLTRGPVLFCFILVGFDIGLARSLLVSSNQSRTFSAHLPVILRYYIPRPPELKHSRFGHLHT
jgi:hypothetical protein